MNEDPLTKYIYANQLASAMNKTKWRELANELTSNPEFEPKVRVKYLQDEELNHGFAHLDWEWVKFGDARCIEWIDISPTKRERVGWLVEDTKTDFSAWVRQALEKHSIPFQEEDGVFRVYGYLRPKSK